MLDSDSRCVSGRAVEALNDGISSTCLVKECMELKESWGVEITKGTYAGWAEVVGQLSEGGAAGFRSGAALQVLQSEGSGSGNGAGPCGVRLWDSVMD